ncbi:MAG: glycoside hydrolase family 25 protein [Kibdelosporangium sp.]
MALGIDIYRYQTVTDWNAVKRHGVSFVYVKGTDGGGPAIVRADAQVRGAQSVGIPVGLYHYAQLSPSPEAQADALTAEVHRLDATGLPPALDLEDPHRPGGAARDFAYRFLNRLRNNGFGSVTLYANTSMLNGITADTLGVPGTVVWAAAYGPDDGNRHPLSYRGRVNIHQYTSVGLVPGISGRVDLNESLTEIPGADMPLSQDDVDRVAAAVWEQHRPHLDPSNGLLLPMWVWTVGANMGAWSAATRPIPAPSTDEITQGLAAELIGPITEELADRTGTPDPEQIALNIARKLVERQSTQVGS